MHQLSRVLLVVVITGSVVLPAEAADGPRGDIAGGYSLIYDHDIKTTFSAGWFFSAAVNAANAFAVAGEVSGHYKSDMKVHTFLAGPRFVAGTGAARFFGQFLVGGATASAGVNVPSGASSTVGGTETELCYMPAVGLDIGFNPKTAMRIGAGERFIRVNGNTSKQFQFVAGLVYRFEK
jgi:hypothetical protein